MTMKTLTAALIALTLTGGAAQAQTVYIPNIPSLWPAEGAFAGTRSAQAGTAAPSVTISTMGSTEKPVPADR